MLKLRNYTETSSLNLPALLILIWGLACGVMGTRDTGGLYGGELIAQRSLSTASTSNHTCETAWSRFKSDQAMALPSGKLKQSEGYHEYMDRLTKEQQEAINSLTAVLDELQKLGFSGFYVTDKHPGPKGYKYTGRGWRGLLVYARRGA